MSTNVEPFRGVLSAARAPPIARARSRLIAMATGLRGLAGFARRNRKRALA